MGRERTALSPVLEVVTALVVLSLVVLLRTYQLGADPPTGLSISSDVETDPPQYTIFARNYIQTDDFDPFDDARRTVFLKSSMTALAAGVFAVLGTGLWQSHVPGIIFSVGALVLFWLFVRRMAGPVAGLLFLFLAALDYNLIFFGRLSFLEHALYFWAFLALVIVTHVRWTWLMFIAGLSLGVGVFFGKALGIVFLFPFACWFGYHLLFDSDKRVWLWRGGLFAAGLAAVLFGWYFFIYAPAQTLVAGYYSEQAIDLYGAPEGLQSIGGFFRQLITFGNAEHLFPRMRVSAILGVGFLLAVLLRVTRGKAWRQGFGPFGAEHIFLAAMIVAWYGSLMIWNYRPLRYQLVLIYAFHAAAAVVLSYLWRGGRSEKTEERKVSWAFYPLALLVAAPAVYQLWSGLAKQFGWNLAAEHQWVWVLLSAAGVAVLAAWWRQSEPLQQGRRMRLLVQWGVFLVVVGVAFKGIADYYFWTQRPTFTARDNGRDLAMTIGPEAVVSGPYGPLLAMENDHEVIIHMFGVAEADTLLFARLPITHLLLDESNEKQARSDYPQVMDSAEHVLTYTVGVDKVRLFRVAGHTGNARADAYQPTLLEQAVDLYHAGRITDGHTPAAEFLERNPQTLMGYLVVGEVADACDQFDLAERSLKGALAFSPTNFDLNGRIAELYRSEYERTGEEGYRQQALEYYERAIHLAPTVSKLKQEYSKLKAGGRTLEKGPNSDSVGLGSGDSGV